MDLVENELPNKSLDKLISILTATEPCSDKVGMISMKDLPRIMC